MRFFGGKKKSRVLDFTEYKSKSNKVNKTVMPVEPTKDATSEGLNFFNNIASNLNESQNTNGNYRNFNQTTNSSEEADFDDRKRKLAKRLMDIKDKLEELSNQIYKVQQRIELIERKVGVSGFG